MLNRRKKLKMSQRVGNDHQWWSLRLCFWVFLMASPSVVVVSSRYVKSLPLARDKELANTFVPSELTLILPLFFICWEKRGIFLTSLQKYTFCYVYICLYIFSFYFYFYYYFLPISASSNLFWPFIFFCPFGMTFLILCTVPMAIWFHMSVKLPFFPSSLPHFSCYSFTFNLTHCNSEV